MIFLLEANLLVSAAMGSEQSSMQGSRRGVLANVMGLTSYFYH